MDALQEKGEAKHQDNTATLSYYDWALKVTKIQQEDTLKHYNYPGELLNYIRALVPNNVKGKILEDL